MKKGDYITIQSWMVNDLKLKGNKLIAFALVYGFSKDEESEFKGSLSYIERSLSCSRNTAIKTMNDLGNDGLIVKRKKIIDKVERNRYSISKEVVQKLNGGSAETARGGSAKTSHKNTNKENTKGIIELDLLKNKKEKVKKARGKFHFSKSKWNDYEKVRANFLDDTEMIKQYKGVDIKYYIESVSLWSDSSDTVRTDRGWLATIKNFMRRDLRQNALVTREMKKPAKEMTLKERLKSGGGSSV